MEWVRVVLRGAGGLTGKVEAKAKATAKRRSPPGMTNRGDDKQEGVEPH
jgi:hypothetical protein